MENKNSTLMEKEPVWTNDENKPSSANSSTYRNPKGISAAVENPETANPSCAPLMPTSETSLGLQKMLEEAASKEEKWTKE